MTKNEVFSKSFTYTAEFNIAVSFNMNTEIMFFSDRNMSFISLFYQIWKQNTENISKTDDSVQIQSIS